MATYSVVFWNDTSAVIPDDWIDLKTKLFRWPDSKNPVSQIVKALPPNDSFHTFQYQRVVDSYDKARNVEIDSQNISINDDEGFFSLQEKKTQNLIERNARIIYKPERYCTTSSDDEAKQTKTICRKRRRIQSLSSSEENEEIYPKMDLPPVPTNYLSKEEQELPKVFKSSALSEDLENRNHGFPLNVSKDSRQ
ncbi:hypothetical protein PV328_012402 [Microctonus aethiopoides]|uniref:Uncharacterized protein n=1 Tax=Microctonus aethiopoides TaxID=144406 RepID=A0AA39KN71_9HYME|nr:hypothetical protein PV328_012402 [Microctonus aethiopoides]